MLQIIKKMFEPAVKSSKSLVDRFKDQNITLTLSVSERYNRPAAKATRVNKNNRVVTLLNYYYSDEDRRTKSLTEFIEAEEKEAARKAAKAEAKKAVRAAFVNPFKVDQIFSDSWGYEQTNVDFYQVIEVKPKSVVVRRIGGEATEATGPMSCQIKPLKDDFLTRYEPELKPVLFYLDQNDKPVYYIKSRHGWCSLHTEVATYHKSWYA